MSLHEKDVIYWLLQGDISVTWQVQSDLLELNEDIYSKTRNLISLNLWD
ncbi:MAG: hypothetical protein HeimC2_16210 [Candidatus Heimdallarchaeota archaeon LC_2]|nr:MAG: hypothetical protein HeimC2_16210 [Candidatus Heimdallarchaeota archaeon LC_2]